MYGGDVGDAYLKIQYLSGLLAYKEVEYYNLKNWSIYYLNGLKDEVSMLKTSQGQTVPKEKVIPYEEYQTILHVITEQDNLIRILNETDAKQKAQIDELNAEVQKQTQNYIQSQQTLHEVFKNNQSLKSYLGVSQAQRNAGNLAQHGKSADDLTESSLQTEFLTSQYLTNQQNLLKLTESKMNVLKYYNQNLKAQVAKYERISKQNAELSGQVHHLNEQVAKGNEFSAKQNDIMEEYHKYIVQLKEQLLYTSKEKDILLEYLELFQMSTKDIETLNNEIIQLENKAQKIRENIENNQNVFGSSALTNNSQTNHSYVHSYIESSFTSYLLNSSTTYKSMNVQYLMEELRRYKYINKGLSSKLHDLKIMYLSHDSTYIEQFRNYVEQLYKKILEQGQELKAKQKMIEDLNKMINILQYENRVLRGEM